MKNLYNTKRIKSFRQGQTVYTVTALGQYSCLQSHRIDGRFKVTKPNSFKSVYELIPSSMFHSGKWFERDIHALDTNVIENNYNNHQLFTSRRKAKSYLKLCLSGTVKRAISAGERWIDEGGADEEWDFDDYDHDDFIDYLPEEDNYNVY